MLESTGSRSVAASNQSIKPTGSNCLIVLQARSGSWVKLVAATYLD